MRLAEPQVLSRSNLRIYLDVDGNAETGTGFAGLGTDLLLDFSPFQDDQRFFPAQGVFYPEGDSLPAAEVIADFFPNGLNDFMTHPASTEFEILIPLEALRGLEPGGQLGILLRNRVSDFAPDLGTTFYIDVPFHLRTPEVVDSLDKEDPDDIRIASWNVLVDGPMNPQKEDAYGRILAATRPDIINFQELYDASTTWARNFVDKWIPLAQGQWYAAKQNDCITVSRFPILDSWAVNGNLVVHVQTEPVWGFDAIIVNAHTPARVENQAARLNETKNFMVLLRNLLNGSRPDAPETDFTILVTGDLNANSPKLELSSPRTGTFVDPVFQGLNYWTDDYRLPLVDAAPRHTHPVLPRLYTWRSFQSDTRQRLDYIYYQQSRLTRRNAFVVDTQTMPAEFLSRYGLQFADARESDHLLLIADFTPRQVDYAWLAEDADVPGWLYSQWMDWLFQIDKSLYYSPLHGFFYSRWDENGMWLWEEELGWWYSSSTLYPYAYRLATDSWLFFRLTPAQPRTYFDFSEELWIP
jgi:exonuclease III